MAAVCVGALLVLYIIWIYNPIFDSNKSTPNN